MSDERAGAPLFGVDPTDRHAAALDAALRPIVAPYVRPEPQDAPAPVSSVADRFWTKVNKSSGRFWNGTECWEWTAGATGSGYGSFFLDGRQVYAHRFSWEEARGPIPEGLEPDHLCRFRLCVNPDHMEAVTHQVNVHRGQAPTAENARKAVCKRGHAFTPENTYITARGNRQCRICKAATNRTFNETRPSRVASAPKDTLQAGRAGGAGSEKGIDGDACGIPRDPDLQQQRARGRDAGHQRLAAGGGGRGPRRAAPRRGATAGPPGRPIVREGPRDRGRAEAEESRPGV